MQKFLKFQRSATSGRHNYNYPMITDRSKFTTKLSLYGMTSFYFLPLESIQNHSPALYASYKKPTQIFGNFRCPILGKPSMPLCGLADRYGRKADLNWKLKISNTADDTDITQLQARDTLTLGIVECRNKQLVHRQQTASSRILYCVHFTQYSHLV